MPAASDPAACVSTTAASLAETISRARNKSATLYERPVTSPALVGCCEVASWLATILASGLSRGISAMAVSTLSVLAGPYSPCGSLAASTWPVSALAITHADAGTLGSGDAAPDVGSTTIPVLAMSGP